VVASNSRWQDYSSISIELDGPDTIGKSFILQNLQIETGIPYKSNAIDKSITNLMATGAIDDVKVFLDPDKTSGTDVALVFKVFTKARIGKSFLKVMRSCLIKSLRNP
jgi:outer membrane protein assembly factor BamA